jgi:hypothetical protein
MIYECIRFLRKTKESFFKCFNKILRKHVKVLGYLYHIFGLRLNIAFLLFSPSAFVQRISIFWETRFAKAESIIVVKD